MTLTKDQSENNGQTLEKPGDKLPDRADALTKFWSVTLPRWLDPWAPRLADAFADGAWTSSWRSVSALAPLLALAAGFLVPQVWPGMRAVYTESLLFIGLIIFGAIFSGPIGVMMFLGHVISMLLWDSSGLPLRTRNQEWLDYFVRREGSLLISYLLLAIPAIIVPQQARWMAEEIPLPTKARPAAGLGTKTILFAVGCGLLIYLWCQAMPVLIRPIFTWLRMDPRVEAIVPLRQGCHWLVVAAAVAAIVRFLAEQRVVSDTSRIGIITALQDQRWSNPERRDEFWRQIPLFVRIAMTAGVITLLFSGLYETWVDALVVAAVSLIFETWRAGLTGRFPVWWERSAMKVPPLPRFVIALVVSYVASYWIVTRQWRGDTFQPVLWAAVLTLIIFYLLFARPTALEETVKTKEPL